MGYQTILNPWWKLFVHIDGVGQNGEAIENGMRENGEETKAGRMCHILKTQAAHQNVLGSIRAIAKS